MEWSRLLIQVVALMLWSAFIYWICRKPKRVLNCAVKGRGRDIYCCFDDGMISKWDGNNFETITVEPLTPNELEEFMKVWENYNAHERGEVKVM